MAKRERPVGVTLVAVLLTLIALIGLHSVIIGSGGDKLLSERFANASAVELFGGAFRLAYAVCAAFCAIGLWEMRPWAVTAYAGWASLLVLGHAIHDSVLKLQGKTDSEWWHTAVALVLVAVLLLLVGISLKRSLKPSA